MVFSIRFSALLRQLLRLERQARSACYRRICYPINEDPP
jgi:hypothetical protein